MAQVRAATDLVALAGEHVALKRQGRRWVGLCPFHSEKTPSFSVNGEEGLYYCFGCQASGDAITFLREVEHLDFVEAVERLADRAGITIRRDDSAASRDNTRRKALFEALEAAVAWYHQRLLSSPDAGPAREYLRSRGYDGDVVRQFQLGWAPDNWDALASALGLSDRVLHDAGLGFKNRAGRQQDAFRARVIFPIFDASGRAVALGGRLLPSRPGAAAGGPKYRNSPETPIYSKRRTLYGLNWAKTNVVETGEVVVCEGYTDVIAMFRAGVPRAVATCGTALAEDHFRLLKRFARRAVLAYDADTAGQAAAERVYEWERRHELDIAVAALPPGTDPDDVARSDPDGLRAAVEAARPFLEFRVERVLAGEPLASAESRVRAAERAMAVVAEHPNELVRDQYLMTVAGRCRVDPDQLRRLARHRPPRRGPAGGDPAPAASSPEETDEGRTREAPRPGRRSPGAMARPGEEALRLAVHRPSEVADLLDESLFSDPVQRSAFRALAGASTLHQALERAEGDAGELLGRLAVEESYEDPVDVMARLADEAGTRELAALRVQAQTSDDVAELASCIGWLKLTLERVRPRPPDLDALRGLVAWLAERDQEDAMSEGRG